MFRKRLLAIAVLVLLLADFSSHAQTKTDAEPAAFYAGTVVDAAGEPVADATVFSTRYTLFAIGDPQPIQSQTKSDSDGKFKIPLYGKTSHSICVYAKGHALWVERFRTPYSSTKSSKDNTIQLEAPQTVEVTILGSNGKPAKIDSAQLRHFRSDRKKFGFFDCGDLPVPVQFEDNRMIVDWLPDDGSVAIEVSCKDHVSQSITIEEGSASKRSAQLSAAARFGCTITEGDQPIQNSSVDIRVFTKPPNNKMCEVSKVAGIRSNVDGKFEIELIEGTVSLTSHQRNFGSPIMPAQFELKADETVKKKIRFGRLITILGRIVDEQGDGIEGVNVHVDVSGNRNVVTNMAGEYEFEAREFHLPRRIDVSEIPDRYSDPFSSELRFGQAGETTTQKVKDIVLPNAFPVSGTVVDSDGKPVEGAYVEAGWDVRISQQIIRKAGGSTHTDSDGKFTLKKPVDAEVALYAIADDLASPKVIFVKRTDRDNVKLVVTDDGVMKLSGKISGTNGTPVKNANIVVYQRRGIPGTSDGRYFLGRPLGECQTSDDGSFEFPIPLYRCEYYGCKISAAGYMGRKIETLTTPESGNPTDFVDFRLAANARSLRGKVVDSSGNAVAGVNVWTHRFIEPGVKMHEPVNHRNLKRSSAKTDAEGKFELSGVHDRSSFVFADKEGYRMTGASIRDGAEENNLTIVSESEPAEKLQFATRDPEERKFQVNQLVDFAKQISKKKLGQTASGHVFDLLMLVDRERIKTMLKEKDLSLGEAAMHAAVGNIEEALETTLALENPRTRVLTLVSIAKRTEDPQQRLVLLNEAGFQLLRIADIENRVAVSSSIIDELLDMGEVDAATDLANLTTPVVLAINGRKNKRGELAKSTYAKALVRIDYDSAWELVKKDNTNVEIMAYKLAAENPDRAIELLGKISRRSSYVPRVACRMATVDPERAFKLVQSAPFSVGNKANGQATLAYILKDSHPEKAKQLLNDAFEALFSSFPRNDDSRIGVMLNLLRFESQICDNGSANFWKIVEKISDPNVRLGNTGNRDELLVQSELALLFAMFDREPEARERLCSILIDRFENPRDTELNSRSTRKNGIAMAAVALHDPQRAIKMVKTFHEKTPAKLRSSNPRPWAVVAGCLARDGDKILDFLATELRFTRIRGE